MKGSTQLTVLLIILAVACVATAVYAGSGLLLLESFGAGVACGFCLNTDPMLFFLFLLISGAFSQEQVGKKVPGGPVPDPIKFGWLGILTTLAGILVCFVFGLLVGALIAELLKSDKSQQ